MEYTFAPFLTGLDCNWYEDDMLLPRLLAHFAGMAAHDAEIELRDWGARCAGTLCELAEISAQPEHQPYLRHFDAYNRRVDEVVLPPSTRRALRIVEGRHRLGALHGDPHVFAAKWYLYLQNGEAGIGCSLACTDGLARALERLGDRPIHAAVLRQIRTSSAERYTHGAQFVTEIQGGSDAATNLVLAYRDGERWRLQGRKWFCSNINADYFLITARPEGAEPGGRGVALFLTTDRDGSDTSTAALDFRYLLGLCKPVFTREATSRLHDAIMVLGGNGIEERFSPLPRLWRDAIVMETWEGSHNVLFTQVVRDMRRYAIDPAAFVGRVAGEARADLARELAKLLASGAEVDAAVGMARFAPKLVAAFGERVLNECR